MQDQPREAAIAIAARAVLRLLPIWTAHCLSEDGRNRRLQALPILRAFLLTSIAPSSPKSMTRFSLSNVVQAVDREAEGVDNVHRIVALSQVAKIGEKHDVQAWVARSSHAVLASADVEKDRQMQSLVETIATAVVKPHAKDAPAWVQIGTVYEAHDNGPVTALRNDARVSDEGEDLTRLALWPGENPLEDRWQTTREDWSRPGSPYAFWRRWYESLLAATPMNPDLLYQIALIDNDIWEKGAEAVAEEIARIEAEHAGAGAGIGEDAIEKGDSRDSIPPNPKKALAKNARTIRLQLDTFKALIESEIEDLRGQNDLSETEHESVSKRIELLRGLIVRIDAVADEFEGGVASSNALVVVEENLPAIVDAADQLEADGGQAQLSETIVSMAASIEHLTKSGTPGSLATGIAGLDHLWTQIRNWRKERKKASKAHRSK